MTKMVVKLRRMQIKSVLKVVVIVKLLILFFMMYFYCFKQSESSSPTKKQPQEHELSFSCHYLKEKDALPVLDKTVTFPPNSIFFIESSCKGLTSRQACSVESAARANPNRQVNVLFTSPITWDMFKDSAISTLLGMINIEAARIHLETYAEETPLYGKFRKNPLTEKDFNMELADILKFLTIYKYTGTYLALDVVVARSFNDLKENWVVKQSPAAMSSDMFSFSSNKNGRTLADIALHFVANDLTKPEDNSAWSFDSSTIIKKVLRMWCLTHDIMFLKTSACPDLEVLEPENFYPISFYDRKKYFSPGDWAKWKDRKIYTYQFWDRFTRYYVYNESSLYAQIAKEYCPMIYKFYGPKFGML